jgi:hypothetical protein
MHHAGLSLFPRLVAAATWLTRLPIEWSMLLWFLFAQFLLLYAAYELARQCFSSQRARSAGVALLAATLNVPVAGTALFMADSYLTARSLSTPLVLMSAACFLGGRYRVACLWLLAGFFLVTTWHWWEWVGVFAPLLILTAFSRLSREPVLPALPRLVKTLIGLGLISTVVALALANGSHFPYLLRLQPMRSFHLIYVVFFVLLGGG